MPEEEVKTEEVVEPEEEVPAVRPVEPGEAPEELGEAEVEEKEEAVAEAAPVEELPNIFVADSSTPPGSLTGPRILYVVDEKKAYPMNNEVNRWVREHDIPIKTPDEVAELEAKIKEVGIEGQTNPPDLAKLTEKLEA